MEKTRKTSKSVQAGEVETQTAQGSGDSIFRFQGQYT
jgi:hypothetical protein